MSAAQHAFAADQYGPRAADYVSSAVHRQGPDLDQIAHLLHGQADAVVLDLGCGGGHVSFTAAPHVARVVACDVSTDMLAAVAAEAALQGLRNITVQAAAAERLPFADATFDIVLSRFTAHHWADLQAGLRQARRVLKPGGWAVFIDTVAPADRVLDTYLQAFEVLRDPSHVRNYSVPEFTEALERAGFTVETPTLRSLRMVFGPWVARTRTPPPQAAAIRALQQSAPATVREAFDIAADGSFDLSAATWVARAA